MTRAAQRFYYATIKVVTGGYTETQLWYCTHDYAVAELLKNVDFIIPLTAKPKILEGVKIA